MFETITEKSHEYLNIQIQELAQVCDDSPDIKEFVRYIIAYSDEMAYSTDGSVDSDIGRELIQFIWQITKIDLSSMANSYHFNPSWAAELNSFIGNYFLDDSAFDFTQKNRGVFEFVYAGDGIRWLQDPKILIEAAKANRAFYDHMDERKMGREQMQKNFRDPNVKVDDSKVFELLETM
jgi:hypothetical protein